MKTHVCERERRLFRIFVVQLHSRTPVHKSWMTDNQRLSLACPTRFHLDRAREVLLSYSPILSLSVSGSGFPRPL